MPQELKDVYKLNSDINRITSQLRQVNSQPETYDKNDFDNINEAYLIQLGQKASALCALTVSQISNYAK